MRESDRFFDAAPRYHLLSAAAVNNSRIRNFVHMKGELSGVGPVFAGVADPIGSGFVASLARRGGRRCWPRSFVALEPRCDPQSNDAAAVLQADAGRVRPLLMITPGTAASRCIFC
jgi:hypothetical protein